MTKKNWITECYMESNGIVSYIHSMDLREIRGWHRQDSLLVNNYLYSLGISSSFLLVSKPLAQSLASGW